MEEPTNQPSASSSSCCCCPSSSQNWSAGCPGATVLVLQTEKKTRFRIRSTKQNRNIFKCVSFPAHKFPPPNASICVSTWIQEEPGVGANPSPRSPCALPPSSLTCNTNLVITHSAVLPASAALGGKKNNKPACGGAGKAKKCPGGRQVSRKFTLAEPHPCASFLFYFFCHYLG